MPRGPAAAQDLAASRDIPLRIVGYNAVISTRDTSGGWMVRQDLLDGGR